MPVDIIPPTVTNAQALDGFRTEIWAADADAPYGSTAFILGYATGSPSYRNYNMRVGTKSADGGTLVGRTIVRGGDSVASGVTARPVYVLAGRGADVGGGDGGSVWIVPGDSVAGSGGAIWLVPLPRRRPTSIGFLAGIYRSERTSRERLPSSGSCTPIRLRSLDDDN